MCDFLQSVHDEFKKILTEQGVLTDEQISISCARAIEVIQFKNSGAVIYLKKHTEQLIKDRNSKIINEYTGRNHRKLASKYQLSVNRIYSIVREGTDNKQTSWITDFF